MAVQLARVDSPHAGDPDPDSNPGPWSLFERDPHPRLGPYVRRLAGYVEHVPQQVRRRELPSGSVVWIVNLGPRYRISAPFEATAPAERGSFVAGLHDRPVIVGSEGVACCMQVDFTPVGAWRFFGVPMAQLARATTEVADVCGAPADRLLERLYEAPDWPARFDVLERFIARRCERGRDPSAGVVWAWERLERTRGAVAIRALSDELGWSRVHLARLFREQIGLPPKTAGQVLRFESAVARLPACARGDLAELALDCGYADQAHMTREFRRFSGWSPTEYLRSGGVEGGGAIET